MVFGGTKIVLFTIRFCFAPIISSPSTNIKGVTALLVMRILFTSSTSHSLTSTRPKSNPLFKVRISVVLEVSDFKGIIVRAL